MRCSLDNEPVFCSCFLKAGSWGKGKRMKEKVKRMRILKEKKCIESRQSFVSFGDKVLSFCLKRGKGCMNHCTNPY